MEQWKSINYEYEVSNLGNVRRIKNEKTIIVKPEILKKGYLRVSIWENGTRNRKLVHRLVAEAFIPNLENKPQIDHINNITSDNRVENLRWATNKENVQHSVEQGRFITEKKLSSYKNKKIIKQERQRLKEMGFKKGNVPHNKGKKGLYKHTEEWKKQASLRQQEFNKIKQTSIICVETGEVFESQAKASKEKKISQGNINRCLKKQRNIAGGYHWQYYTKEREEQI